MRCYGAAGLRSGEIPVEGMESRFAGKSARLRPFCLVLVVGSAESIGTVGGFWWGLRRAEPRHRLQPQELFVSLQLQQSNLPLK